MGNGHQIFGPKRRDSHPFEGMTFGIIGFKSDKGVYINNGRVGAVEGPKTLFDPKLPNFHGTGEPMSQFWCREYRWPQSLSRRTLRKSLKRIQRMYQLGIQTNCPRRRSRNSLRPLSRDSIQFLQKDEQLAVINLDAHFDLRPYDQTGPNSGTGFRQMADHAKEKEPGLPYFILGSKSITITSSSLTTLLKHQALIS